MLAGRRRCRVAASRSLSGGSGGYLSIYPFCSFFFFRHFFAGVTEVHGGLRHELQITEHVGDCAGIHAALCRRDPVGRQARQDAPGRYCNFKILDHCSRSSPTIPRAPCAVLYLSVRADGMLTGACNPMICPIHVVRWAPARWRQARRLCTQTHVCRAVHGRRGPGRPPSERCQDEQAWCVGSGLEVAANVR